jgi:hypothetical protein
MIRPRFTNEEMERANEAWGANCGPGAVAAILGLTMDEVKTYFISEGFIDKHYTNPTMMYGVLNSIGRPWRKGALDWPRWGLVRIQWEGPWTQPGVPMHARHRHTHWVGATTSPEGVGIFDINAMANGTGWAALSDWERVIVPWILEACVPRANGRWHITHAIEIDLHI